MDVNANEFENLNLSMIVPFYKIWNHFVAALLVVSVVCKLMAMMHTDLSEALQIYVFSMVSFQLQGTRVSMV